MSSIICMVFNPSHGIEKTAVLACQKYSMSGIFELLKASAQGSKKSQYRYEKPFIDHLDCYKNIQILMSNNSNLYLIEDLEVQGHIACRVDDYWEISLQVYGWYLLCLYKGRDWKSLPILSYKYVNPIYEGFTAVTDPPLKGPPVYIIQLGIELQHIHMKTQTFRRSSVREVGVIPSL